MTDATPRIEISPSRKELRDNEKNEVVLEENSERWVLFPIEFPSLWEFYKKIETSFWTPEDFPWKDEADKIRTATLADWQRKALLTLSLDFNLSYGVPASIIGADNSVNAFLFPDILDLSCEFVEALQAPEGRAYLGFQAMFENFHREVFTKYVSTLAPSDDTAELRKMYLQEQLRPSLVAKQKWLAHHMEGFHREDKIKMLAGDLPDLVNKIVNGSDNPAPMAEILVAFVVMKCIFTSGIALMHDVVKDTPSSAIYKSTERLWTDLVLHADFTAHLYSSLSRKIEPKIVRAMLTQAIELEYEYLVDVSDSNLNSENVCRFLIEMAGRALSMMGFADSELSLTPNLPVREGGRLAPATMLPIPPLFQVVHSGPFRILPKEKRAAAESSAAPGGSNATTALPVFQTDDDF